MATTSGNNKSTKEEDPKVKVVVEAQLGKTLKEGERIVGPTRRPDGTLRKPIRIRAGYVPQDEVAIYQSKGTLWRKEMESQVGPPGYDPATDTKTKSKAVKRNERKKEKRQQAAVEKAKNSDDTVDQDNEETEYAENTSTKSEPLDSVASQISNLSLSKSTTAEKASSNPVDGSNTDNTGVDIGKKIRALKKKIRLTEAQLQKASPEDMKKPEQLERVKKLEGWHEELKLLEDEKAAESSAS